jgi:hypothetical protein
MEFVPYITNLFRALAAGVRQEAESLVPRNPQPTEAKPDSPPKSDGEDERQQRK